MTDQYPTWATIYTDASGLGGWATYIRYSKPPYRILTAGKSPYKDSSAGELFAIVRAVDLALKQWDCISGVGIRTDSQAAIKLCQYNAKLHQRQDLSKLQKEFNAILRKGNNPVYRKLIWVPGHQKNTTVQAYLNNWCDQYARSASVKL